MSTAIDIVEDGSQGEKDQLISCAPIPAALRPTVSVVPSGSANKPPESSNSSGGDLQMGHCVVLRNGALLLPSTQNTSDSWFTVKMPELEPKHVATAIAHDESSELQPRQEASVSFNVPDMPGDADDSGDEHSHNTTAMTNGEALPSTPPNASIPVEDSPMSGLQLPFATSSTMTLRERRKSRTLTVQSDDALNDIVVEEWELLDPHEMPEIPQRPFRRGKTYKVPKDLSDPYASSDGQRIQGGPQKPQQEGNVQFVRIRAPFFEEFDDLYDAEMKRRRNALNTLRREQQRRDRALNNRDNMSALAAAIASKVNADPSANEEDFFANPYATVRENDGELDVPIVPNDDSDDDDAANFEAPESDWAQRLDLMDDKDDDDEAFRLANMAYLVRCQPTYCSFAYRIPLC